MSDIVYVPVWEEATEVLVRDPVFGRWVREVGPVEVPSSDDEPFCYLTRAICYQQLAGAAAATIHGRVVEALDGCVEPERVLRTPEETLRGAGLSRNKLAAIRDLAEKIESGDVPVSDLADLPDDEVVERLTRVRGIGEWTAQMYLMFRLRRPDVWPVGDLGVRQGFAWAHEFDPAPTAKELRPMGEPYRPWRSAVAWYCWRILETELP
ncbi:MAG: DNA-3-methyladenine glycosylase 2 family protein [Gemmatimonadetes bacterium]|nr:DNA-3-methyladenine glycosylase 2 family protein [Gemmatimonadota bacterium]NNL29854.1 DNA-3-methyladenine glycosylase 2 family protein [Gemmatimonadota bacterium]